MQCVIHSWRFVHRWRVATLLVSARTASVAHMFDTGLPGPEDLAGADDSLVIAAITGWACVEANATYRNHGTHADAIEITCDPTPHRLPDARMPDGRHRRFGHRSRRCTTIRPLSFGVIKRPGVHRRHQPRRNRPRPVHLAGGRIPA